MEGAFESLVILRVLRSWRAGLIYVQSEAVGGSPHPLAADDDASVGREQFVVALDQQEDAAAQAAAQKYAWAESLVRQTSSRERDALERKTYPTLAHKLGVTRDGALDKNWQEQVLFRGTADAELLSRLPGDVRAAFETLVNARRALSELNTTPRRVKAMIAG